MSGYALLARLIKDKKYSGVHVDSGIYRCSKPNKLTCKLYILYFLYIDNWYNLIFFISVLICQKMILSI